MNVVIVGTDEHDIATAIAEVGHDVSHVDIGNRDALVEAGIEAAGVYVLTEVAQATSIPIAKEHNPEVKVVVYADGSLPDFARGQADLALDPALFEPADVAAELDA